jgi:hypothetical protein
MKHNRIRVGFHRVGIALAVLPVVGSLGLVAVGTYEWVRPLVKPPIFEIQDTTTGKTARVRYGTDPKIIGQTLKELLSPRTVPADMLAGVDQQLETVDRERHDGLLHILIGALALGLGFAFYAASWLIGWIIRGFLGDDDLPPG